jgi:hypothetical protein
LHRFGSIACIQLFDDPLPVGVDRVHADEQFICNLLADQSFGQQLQDFLFEET